MVELKPFKKIHIEDRVTSQLQRNIFDYILVLEAKVNDLEQRVYDLENP